METTIQHLKIANQTLAIITYAKDIFYTFILSKNIEYNFKRETLYEIAIEQVETFEKVLYQASFTINDINNAKYMACTFLDEAITTCAVKEDQESIQNYKSLVDLYYRENIGGEKFFTILNGMSLDDRNNLPILSLGRYMLCLGFQGKYAIENTNLEIDILKNRIFATTDSFLRKLPKEDILQKKNNFFHYVKTIKQYLNIAVFLSLVVSVYCAYEVINNKTIIDKMLDSL